MKNQKHNSKIFSVTNGLDLGKGIAFVPYNPKSKDHIDVICKKWGYESGDYFTLENGNHSVISNIYSKSTKIYDIKNKKKHKCLS